MGQEEQSTDMVVARKESRNIFKLSNICILIYILMNILLIWSILSWFTYTLTPLLWSLGVYALSLAIALSPIGEFALRVQMGCRSLKKRPRSAAILQPLFDEVYAKAKEQLPNLPDNIRIYISDDAFPNAFATGRRTICATRGLLEMPPEQVKAVLAHEFGHIAHRDTYLLQGVLIGNFIVTFLVTTIRILAWLVTGFAHISAKLTPKGDLGIGRSLEILFTGAAHVLVIVGFNVFMWVWSRLGVLLVMKTSRENEYEADRFSANCGYAQDLIAAFQTWQASGDGKPTGIFAALSSSHPDFDSRIAQLEEVAN